VPWQSAPRDARPAAARSPASPNSPPQARNNQQIADVLNAEGFRPPKRTSRFTGQQVRTLINQRGIRGQRKGRPAVLTSLAPGEWSVTGLSAELGMPTASIYNWIYRGWIAARHAPGTRNWIITADDEHAAATRTQGTPARLLHPRPLGTARTRTRPETRNTAMRKQRNLTGTSGGLSRWTTVMRTVR